MVCDAVWLLVEKKEVWTLQRQTYRKKQKIPDLMSGIA
jgi:hypothetical protein